MNILISSIIDLQKTPYSRLHHFIEHFLKKGHKVTVISIRDFWKHKTLQNQELASRIEIRYISDKKMSPMFQKISAVKNINKLLKGIKCDVHLSYNSLVLSYYIAKRLKVPTVYDLADDLPEMVKVNPNIPFLLRPAGMLAAKYFLSRNLKMAKAVTVSAKEFEKTMKIRNSIYIPNGVNTDMFKPREVHHPEFVIGYLGALREWVDLRPMFLACKSLTSKNLMPESKILIVGGEEDLPKYKDFVFENSIDNVEFTGNVPYQDVPKYIANMNIATIPFVRNRVTDGTCPLKLLEYMAMEKPCIVTQMNETKAMVGNRVLYAANQSDWEEKIRFLYENPSAGKKMGEEGRVFVQRNFNWKDICKRMEGVLLQVKK